MPEFWCAGLGAGGAQQVLVGVDGHRPAVFGGGAPLAQRAAGAGRTEGHRSGPGHWPDEAGRAGDCAWPAPRDICPHTGRGRLGYDRARILFRKYTATTASGGLELHQLRHSAATHLGDQKVPLQLIMAKTRHKSPRTVMRYVKPGDEAVAEVTSLLGPLRRSH